jgi:Leucine-rich repeat (LRR) protein
MLQRPQFVEACAGYFRMCMMAMFTSTVAGSILAGMSAVSKAGTDEAGKPQTPLSTEPRLMPGASNSDVAAFIERYHPSTLVLDGSSVTDDGLGILRAHQEIDHLQLNGLKITAKGLQHVTLLKNLRVLCLGNVPVGDEAAVFVGAMPRLEILDLRGTRVTDVGLKYLSACKQLKSLSLSNCAIGDAGVRHLANLTQLEVVDLTRTRITDAGLRQLGQLTGLQCLILERCAITDVGVDELRNLVTVTGLDLTDTNAGDKTVQLIAKHFSSSCKSVSLGRNTTDAALSWLAKMKDLMSLSICNTKITDDGLRLHKFPFRLFSLTLSGSGLSDAAIASFDAANLEVLRCHGIRRTPGALLALAKMPRLESLTLTGTSYSDVDLGVLRKLSCLRRLELAGPSITDGVVPILKSLPNTELFLDGTSITKEKRRLLHKEMMARWLKSGGWSDEEIRQMLLQQPAEKEQTPKGTGAGNHLR